MSLQINNFENLRLGNRKSSLGNRVNNGELFLKPIGALFSTQTAHFPASASTLYGNDSVTLRNKGPVTVQLVPLMSPKINCCHDL